MGLGSIVKATTEVTVKGLSDIAVKESTKLATKSLTEGIVKGSLESGIKSLTEGIVKGTSEGIVKGATEIGLKSGTEAGIKAAADAGIKAGVEIGAKAGAEVGVKAGAEVGAKAGLEVGAKAGAEAGVKAGVEVGAKAGAEAGAKAAAEISAQVTSKSSKFVKAGKYAVGAAVVIGGVWYIADPFLEAYKKNGKKLGIISIKDSSSLSGTANTVNITYVDPIDISIKDTITLTGTNCSPIIDGDYKLTKIISNTELQITLNSKLVLNGTAGTITLHTNADNQRELLNTGIQDIIGDGLSTPFKGIMDAFDKIFGDLGDTFKKGLFVVLGIIVLIVLYKLYRFAFPPKIF